MSTPFDAAVSTLFQAALSDFVAERKRLAVELKAAGDKEGATKLTKLARPPVSAWAVNQLWWTERESFDALLEAAARIKAGEREASKEHREALAVLRERATQLLAQAGNAASEGTLRRVATTLAAIAASGSFEPDAPGALTADRDPPGFETFVMGSAPATAAVKPAPTRADEAPANAALAEARRAEAAAKAEREARAAQLRAEEEERQRRLAERERLSAALKEARQQQAERHREVARLKSELERAEQDLKQTQALLAQLESQLASL